MLSKALMSGSFSDNPIAQTHPLFSIITCCVMKIHEDWNCSVKHGFREQNYTADALAAKSYEFNHGLHVFKKLLPFFEPF